MANNNSKSTIVDSWSLIAFARLKGPRMQVASFTNSQSGDKFKSCVFTNKDDNVCFVAFSSNLGELTPKQIAAQKDDLQVVELETEGYEETHYSLCRKGENNWKDVDLGL